MCSREAVSLLEETCAGITLCSCSYYFTFVVQDRDIPAKKAKASVNNAAPKTKARVDNIIILSSHIIDH